MQKNSLSHLSPRYFYVITMQRRRGEQEKNSWYESEQYNFVMHFLVGSEKLKILSDASQDSPPPLFLKAKITTDWLDASFFASKFDINQIFSLFLR